MIKCEVVFDGDEINFNHYEISKTIDGWYVGNNTEWFMEFSSLEEAIKYCMEN